jgi:hypothetical protein
MRAKISRCGDPHHEFARFLLRRFQAPLPAIGGADIAITQGRGGQRARLISRTGAASRAILRAYRYSDAAFLA